MKAIIGEDEQVAREAIVGMARGRGIEVLAVCKTGAETLRSVRASNPDLLFLDVQMPGLNGFDVLRGIRRDCLPTVIFTTAYDRYAVRAFEHNAIDFLLKPFDEERFCRAVDRAESQVASQAGRQALLQLLAAEIQLRQAPQRLVVRSRGQLTFVKVADIDWIEAHHNYLRLYTSGEVHLLRKTSTEIESELPPEYFLRIQRSLIVNVDCIRRLKPCGYGEYLVELKNGKNLPLSRSYREHLDSFIEKIEASARPVRTPGR